MNINYEEAKLRFKPGDQFKVNDEIHKKSAFRAGDIVSLINFYGDGFNWGINCKFVEQVPGERLLAITEILAIHSKYLDVVASQPNHSACACNIMIGPCHCGAFQREKESGITSEYRKKHTYF